MSILLNQVFNLHTARMLIVVTFVFTKKKKKETSTTLCNSNFILIGQLVRK